MMQVVKPTLLFDFDGTLADTLALSVPIFNSLAAKYGGRPINPQEVPQWQALPARQFLRAMRMPLWRVPAFIAEGQGLLAERKQEIPVFPGVVAALNRFVAAGGRWGVVSSNRRDIIAHVLTAHHFPSPLWVVTERSLFGKGAVLKRLVHQHHLDMAATFYVGDEVRDIEAARQAGLPFIGVSWGYNTAETLRHHNAHVIEQPSAILKAYGKTPLQGSNP